MIPKKRKRAKCSPVWQEFIEQENSHKCKHCAKLYQKQASGTSSLLKHIRSCSRAPAEVREKFTDSRKLKQQTIPVIEDDLWKSRVDKVKGFVMNSMYKQVRETLFFLVQ